MKEKDFTRKEVKTRREALVLVVRKGANGGQPQAGFCVSSAMNEERVVLNLYRYGSFWLIKPWPALIKKVVWVGYHVRASRKSEGIGWAYAVVMGGDGISDENAMLVDRRLRPRRD